VRGHFVHNDVLLDPAVRLLRQHGADVHSEHPIALGSAWGSVDSFAIWRSLRIVIEAELSPERVAKDVTKAVALEADLLLIIVPNWRVARGARKKLEKLGVPAPSQMEFWILPLGTAMKRLRDLMSLLDSPECLTDINTLNLARRAMEGEATL